MYPTRNQHWKIIWRVPKHEICWVNFLSTFAVLDDAPISNNSTLLVLWFRIWHILDEADRQNRQDSTIIKKRHSSSRIGTHIWEHLEDFRGDGKDAAGVHLISQLCSCRSVPLGGEQKWGSITAARQRHPTGKHKGRVKDRLLEIQKSTRSVIMYFMYIISMHELFANCWVVNEI